MISSGVLNCELSVVMSLFTHMTQGSFTDIDHCLYPSCQDTSCDRETVLSHPAASPTLGLSFLALRSAGISQLSA